MYVHSYIYIHMYISSRVAVCIGFCRTTHVHHVAVRRTSGLEMWWRGIGYLLLLLLLGVSICILSLLKAGVI